MQTASGQAVKDSSNRNSGQTRGRRARRRGLNPRAIAISAFLFVISLLVMGASLLGYWPPKSADANMTVAEQWQAIHTATPGTQYLNGLKVEKVGKPLQEIVGTEKIGNHIYENSTVTVTLKVTNNVMIPEPNKPGSPPVEAYLYSGTVRVLFYNVENGKQVLVGGGSGTLVNMNYGDSQTIDVVATPIQNYSDATQYEAFPDSLWTDKDPVKSTPTK